MVGGGHEAFDPASAAPAAMSAYHKLLKSVAEKQNSSGVEAGEDGRFVRGDDVAAPSVFNRHGVSRGDAKVPHQPRLGEAADLADLED